MAKSKGKPRQRTKVKPTKSEQPKQTDEEKLLKLLGKERNPTGPLITSPKIFEPLFTICSFYMAAYQGSQASRELLSRMALQFRNEALTRHGHPTIETIKLAELLRPPKQAKVGIPDAITFLAKAKKLNVEQVSAAEQIRHIWSAFGKGLMGGGSDPSRLKIQSGKYIHPMDRMDEDTWESYKTVYIPWYTQVAKIIMVRDRSGIPITAASIIFKILVEDHYPEVVDRTYELKKESSLRVLLAGLRYYWRPLAVGKAIRRVNAVKKPLGSLPDPVKGLGAMQEPSKAFRTS